jgi:hypothetical protein
MLQLLKKTVFLILAAISVAACSSSDPEYVDPEAHEKTIQLNEKYGPVLVGTWHFEKIGEKQRYFERLTFQADGTLTGMRKWQMRELVTINGEQVYTDWEDVKLGVWEDEDIKQNGTFSGTWKLRYWDPYGDGKQNYLELSAKYDNKDINFAAYRGSAFVKLWLNHFPAAFFHKGNHSRSSKDFNSTAAKSFSGIINSNCSRGCALCSNF